MICMQIIVPHPDPEIWWVMVVGFQNKVMLLRSFGKIELLFHQDPSLASNISLIAVAKRLCRCYMHKVTSERRCLWKVSLFLQFYLFCCFPKTDSGYWGLTESFNSMVAAAVRQGRFMDPVLECDHGKGGYIPVTGEAERTSSQMQGMYLPSTHAKANRWHTQVCQMH